MTLAKLITATIATLFLMFFAPLLGVLFGALSGWVVGLFVEDTIISFMGRIGVKTAGLEVWHIGAAMGFLGGFLKTNPTISKD